jgi:FKBP-type peptidyl-prolyl cis-trans isomerase 2
LFVWSLTSHRNSCIVFHDDLFAVFLIGKHDGKKFLERDAKFTLGEGCEISIVDGVEEALKSMKNGEQAKLKVQSRYGYGSEGHERYGVPPDADLEFEVHLKSYFPVNYHIMEVIPLLLIMTAVI